MGFAGISAYYEFELFGLTLKACVKFDGDKIWIEISGKGSPEKKRIELDIWKGDTTGNIFTRSAADRDRGKIIEHEVDPDPNKFDLAAGQKL